MPTYRELLQQVRAEIAEVDAARARELVDAAAPGHRRILVGELPNADTMI